MLISWVSKECIPHKVSRNFPCQRRVLCYPSQRCVCGWSSLDVVVTLRLCLVLLGSLKS
ncbi:hypothetical protein LINPERPRIM_LOCUS4971 [Linum perenne]